MANRSICSVHGCGKPVKGYGWCGLHLRRWKKGRPFDAPIKTPNGAAARFLEFAAHVETDDCVKWPFATKKDGYGVVHFRGKQPNASHAVCIIAHGEPPSSRHEAAHSCGNGNSGCVNGKHLRWALPAENHADKRLHGTLMEGEATPAARLTAVDVLAIRDLLASGMAQRAIADRFGISQSNVSKIHLALT